MDPFLIAMTLLFAPFLIAGSITIKSGTIEAQGGTNGAGISGRVGGTIEISSGNIIATGGSSAPNDIGYGFDGNGASDSIKLTGYSVNATNVNPQPTTAVIMFNSTP